MSVCLPVHTRRPYCFWMHANWDRPSKERSLPWWLSREESACQCRRLGFDPWVGKISLRRKEQPTPVFLPGEFHGHKSLVGYSPWGFKESDMTEQRLNNKWRGPHHKDKGQPPANCPQELNPAPTSRVSLEARPFPFRP